MTAFASKLLLLASLVVVTTAGPPAGCECKGSCKRNNKADEREKCPSGQRFLGISGDLGGNTCNCGIGDKNVCCNCGTGQFMDHSNHMDSNCKGCPSKSNCNAYSHS